jgi:hypothetical protein
MEINSSTSSVQGIRNAFDANAARAARLAQPNGGPQFEKDMAELPSDEHKVTSNLKALKTKDAMLGTLLDMVG